MKIPRIVVFIALAITWYLLISFMEHMDQEFSVDEPIGSGVVVDRIYLPGHLGFSIGNLVTDLDISGHIGINSSEEQWILMVEVGGIVYPVRANQWYWSRLKVGSACDVIRSMRWSRPFMYFVADAKLD